MGQLPTNMISVGRHEPSFGGVLTKPSFSLWLEISLAEVFPIRHRMAGDPVLGLVPFNPAAPL